MHVRPLVRTATAKHIHLTHFIGHDHAGTVTGRREGGGEGGWEHEKGVYNGRENDVGRGAQKKGFVVRERE